MWGNPGNPAADKSLTSVYGFVEVDTKSFEKSISVKFYELDSENNRMIELYKVTVINTNVTDVHIQPSETPTSYLATQNYPNPFNGPTIIEYRLPETSEVELVVYDLHGREVVNH